MTKITIKQIKQTTKQKYPNLFTNKTLKFFGQSLDSFKVFQGLEYLPFLAVIIAPIYSKLGDFMGYFIRGYNGNDLLELSTTKQAEIIKQYKESK